MTGKIAAPADVAEYPCTCINVTGNRKKKMPIAAYRKRVNRFAPRKERDLNKESETIGEDALDSTHRKRARRIRPPSKLPSTMGCRQPSFEDSRSPVTTQPRLAVASAAPSQSRCPARELLLSGTWRRESITTAAASGRFRKNAHRQLAYSMSAPPRTGPRAVVMAVKPDQVPIACPRFRSSNDALMMARLPGTRRAAPIP